MLLKGTRFRKSLKSNELEALTTLTQFDGPRSSLAGITTNRSEGACSHRGINHIASHEQNGYCD
jgi:hypothetical protein